MSNEQKIAKHRACCRCWGSPSQIVKRNIADSDGACEFFRSKS